MAPQLLKTLLIAAIATLPLTGHTQTKEQAKTKVKADATKMSQALVDKDYKTFVSTTYPKAVEMTPGGLPQMEEDLKTQIAGIEAQNNKILSAYPGDPSVIVDTAGEWQCTIPQKMVLQVPGAKVLTETTLIALSPDKGKTWYFMDTADRDLKAMRGVFPNISSKLVIPKSPDPVVQQ